MFETAQRKRNTYFFLKTKDMLKTFFFMFTYIAGYLMLNSIS